MYSKAQTIKAVCDSLLCGDSQSAADTARNGYSATFAAAYTVRPKSGAPVSAPCTWDEIERGQVGPQAFTLRTMAKRMATVGDLWEEMPKQRRSLTRPIEQLRRIAGQ